MPVNDAYREWVLEQLGRVLPVTSRRMFGGVGVYADGFFFALLDDDRLNLKVDDVNRPSFEAAGARPFAPSGEGGEVMQYYPPPEEDVEDPERLRPWVEGSLDAARRARLKRRR